MRKIIMSPAALLLSTSLRRTHDSYWDQRSVRCSANQGLHPLPGGAVESTNEEFTKGVGHLSI